MKILVSGAGGFLGRFVVERLTQKGHTVRAIIRPHSSQPRWDHEVEIFDADLAHNDLLSAFDGIDAAIHLAVAKTEGGMPLVNETVLATQRFLTAMAQSTVKRLVHVSSLVVYDWSRANRVLDEDTSLLQDPREMGPYTIAKVEQERIVNRFAKSNAWKLTVIRPGFIWGPSHAEVAGMGRHIGPIFVMFGPRTHLPLCHVVNCAHCLGHVLESEAAIGESFNVIDFEVPVSRYVSEYAARIGQSWFFLPLPYSFGLSVARLASLATEPWRGLNARLPSLLNPRRFEAQFKPLRFPNRKVRNLLEWVPLLSLDACFDVTYGPALRTSTLR